jgi:hypothetical protein
VSASTPFSVLHAIVGIIGSVDIDDPNTGYNASIRDMARQAILRPAPSQVVSQRAHELLLLIPAARDHHADHGRYPFPPNGPDQDQGFDDWAADVVDEALRLLPSQIASQVPPQSSFDRVIASAVEAHEETLREVLTHFRRNTLDEAKVVALTEIVDALEDARIARSHRDGAPCAHAGGWRWVDNVGIEQECRDCGATRLAHVRSDPQED